MSVRDHLNKAVERGKQGYQLGKAIGQTQLGIDNHQMSGSLVNQVIGLVILVILVVGFGIPLTNDVINQANLSGTEATVVGFIPEVMGLVVLIAAFSAILRRQPR